MDFVGKMPTEYAQSVLLIAEAKYVNHQKEIEGRDPKTLFMTAFLAGYQECHALYFDENEELLKDDGDPKKR